ncbi:putative leucine-rich repeat receptor-like protein kinase At2g19210 [Cornus florida]|uniref:putative leucine-rich repeat receptor-like protein kinase At2g19210 n=1 Tax=Cornus florida TaxID=4283 RepID=UPI0028A23B52|nr:putative leucine-rich repeat receptor-like protein kinase At2g19210 [Cornus florida]
MEMPRGMECLVKKNMEKKIYIEIEDDWKMYSIGTLYNKFGLLDGTTFMPRSLQMMISHSFFSAFISLDCGISENSSYTDQTTGIRYSSDAAFIDTGVSKTISPEFKKNSLYQQFLNVRSFPEGTRNCYTIRPAKGTGNKYLIRAWFMYGNYDAEDKPPTFDLQLGVDFWDRISLTDSSSTTWSEIIHVLSSDYIYVCLLDKGLGTPFISALELRPLNNSMYETTSGSLVLFDRVDLGSTTNQFIRYQDDVYDRVWNPTNLSSPMLLRDLSTINSLASNLYQLPSTVMSTAMVSQNASDSINLWWTPSNSSDQFYMYMHFAEVEVLQLNQSREFYIYINGTPWLKDRVVPDYLSMTTVYSTKPLSFPKFDISINKTKNSTLPPIINGMEVYTVRQIIHSQTDDTDVAGINGIKSTYGVKRNWQGDPCAPEAFSWVGLTCSYDGFNPPRITSLNLSSSGLSGEISPYISNLTVIKSLDLSNNKLTGQVPSFLSQMASLTVLNLRGNNFTGSVPEELLQKSKNGSLLLSIDGNGATENTNPCQSVPCKKKKNKVVIPVVASVTALFVLLIAIGSALWIIGKRKRASKENEVSFDVKNREFAYSEVQSITNNFQRVVGKGGFGTVYHGHVGDTQVAVKMLSSSSIQGYKEFQAEAKLLMSVHHKNLTSLVGYCNEGTNMGIIYEYMANGDLAKHLSGTHVTLENRNQNVLSWEERLQIATDAAQGLEYLHHGCKPPIIHRDVKSTNILLNEKFQAKIADFGLSRVIPTEGGTHVSTIVAGTPGYLDPEYFISNWLTEKSDVYSFGIVILEIITGQPAILRSPNNTHIIQWVNSMLANRDVISIIDAKLKKDYDVNSAWKAVELAMACVSHTSTKRPTMNHVVMELKECLAMEVAQHDSYKSMDSIGMMPMNLESGMSPMAR